MLLTTERAFNSTFCRHKHAPYDLDCAAGGWWSGVAQQVLVAQKMFCVSR